MAWRGRSGDGGVRNAGGEAASLREAPLPQTPSPEERLGIGLRFSFGLRAHDMWARFLVLGVVAFGDKPLRPPTAGTSPFRGGFAGSSTKRKGSFRRRSSVCRQSDCSHFAERCTLSLVERQGVFPPSPFLQAPAPEDANRFEFFMTSPSETNPNDTRKVQRSMWETGGK